MTKQEVTDFIKKIKAYYPYFSIEDKESMDEWALKLKPYDKEDILQKFEEHLSGEKSNEPPKLHFLTKYLRTTEEKARVVVDPLVRCNLCGREMNLSIYDRHYDKCLCITTLMRFLKKDGQEVTYEELEGHSYEKLDNALRKYLPQDKAMGTVVVSLLAKDG